MFQNLSQNKTYIIVFGMGRRRRGRSSVIRIDDDLTVAIFASCFVVAVLEGPVIDLAVAAATLATLGRNFIVGVVVGLVVEVSLAASK